MPADNGLKYYDLEEGSGSPVESGDKVTVRSVSSSVAISRPMGVTMIPAVSAQNTTRLLELLRAPRPAL